MGSDCLAKTGDGVVLYVAAALAVIVLAGILLRFRGWSRPMGIRALVVVGAFIALCSNGNVYAAPACDAGAQPDTSSGLQGQPQTYNVLGNDKPSDGAHFVVSSLLLRVPENPVQNTQISDDKKTITVPGEGVYKANADGSITFSPEANFVGQAKGVYYEIRDSNNLTVVATYQPTVQGGAVATCKYGSFNTTVLRDAYAPGGRGAIVSLSPFVTNATYVADDTGQRMVAKRRDTYLSMPLFITNDHGGSWAELSAAGSRFWTDVVISGNGTKIVAFDKQNTETYFSLSNDGGGTWQRRMTSLPAMAYGYRAIMSRDGNTLLAFGSDGLSSAIFKSVDQGLSWAQIITSVDFSTNFALSYDGTKLIKTDYTSVSISSDLGASWVPVTTLPQNTSSFRDPIISTNGDWYVKAQLASQDKMYRSSDMGQTWNEVVLPAQVTSISNIAASNDGSKLLIFDGNAGYLTTDKGNTWTSLGAYSSNKAAISNNGQIISMVINSEHLVSTNGGTSWTSMKPEQSLIADTIDLDPNTPGVQQSISAPDGNWTVTYDPALDTVRTTVSPTAPSNTYQIPYTITLPGCQSPVSAQLKFSVMMYS